MHSLNRDGILQADDIKIEEVLVPEWGGWVRVRGLTATERDDYEQSIVSIDSSGARMTDMANFRARLVVRCVVDEKGVKLFKPDDAEILGRKSAAAVDRLWAVAQRLSGLSKEDVAELRKNSAGQSADSSSG